jgi:VCBS repeat-containing protein
MAKELPESRTPGSGSEKDKRPERRSGDEPDRKLKKATDRPIGQPEGAREEAPIGWDFGPDGPPLDKPGDIPGERAASEDDRPADEITTASLQTPADRGPGGKGGPDEPGENGTPSEAEPQTEAGDQAMGTDYPPSGVPADSGDSSVGRIIGPDGPLYPPDTGSGPRIGGGPGHIDSPDPGATPSFPGGGPLGPGESRGATGEEPGRPRDGTGETEGSGGGPSEPGGPDRPGGGAPRPPEISGPAAGDVQEDVTLAASGQLTASGSGGATWSLVGNDTGPYGGFTLGSDGFWSYALDNDAAQGLKAGEIAQEIFTVKVIDASGAFDMQTVTVTITGNNDAPVMVSWDVIGFVQEDEALSTKGTLMADDPDLDETETWSIIGDSKGAYGSFALNPDGSWSYALDNDKAQGLKAGETAEDIFTIRVTDCEGASDTQTLAVSVTGTNDVPVISGTVTGLVQEDEALTASGTLTSTDADIGDTVAWSVVGPGDGQYGSLILGDDGTWSYTLDNDAAQGLKAGETAQEIFTVKVTDAEGASDTRTITVTVKGTNDAPVISGTETGLVQEDEGLTASGTLTASDPDIGDTAAWSVVSSSEGRYGSLALGDDGSWSYTLDNDAAQGLKAGETAQEIFTVKVTDAEGASDTQTITVTVNGTNDAPVISGAGTGIVQEDEALTASSRLTALDPDIGDNANWSVVGETEGSYGVLTLDPDGSWSYTLDNDAAQGLKAGESAEETFTVRVTDAEGASADQTIAVTVHGTNDIPVISGTGTGAVREDETLTVSGMLAAADADIGDTATWSIIGEGGGAYGSLVIDGSGAWTYTLDNDAAQGLKAGDTAQEIFTVRVTDSAGASTTQTVTVTVTGTNDAPVISESGTGLVQEDEVLTASGTLTSTDADIGDTATWSVTGSSSGHYGSLVLGDDGQWSYALNNDMAQGLKAGETAQEIFTVKVTDASGASETQTVTVTVTGTNDQPVISGTGTGSVQEDEKLTASGTLTSTDADIGDTAGWSLIGSSTGSYGSLVLGDDGHWSYTLDNNTAQGLKAGETAQEIFTVRVTDAAGADVTQTITVTVTGTNDTPMISGTATGIVQEDEIPSVSGTLTISDADIGDTASWSVLGSGAGQYGSFVLGDDGAWSYTLDNNAAQGLKAGDIAQEIFTVKVTDASGASATQTVTVTVNGTNDTPVISGSATGAVEEDGIQTASGTLSSADADIGDTATWSVVGNGDGAYGSITLDQDRAWSYTLDNDAAHGLKAGDTAQEIFTVKVTDASGAEVTQTVTVTVTGTNDAPAISGTKTGSVQEDEALTASGALTSTDADIGDTAAWSLIGSSDGSYGSLALDPDGGWSYSLNNDTAQGLKAGETAQEIFTVKATDTSGASDTQTVTITVIGTNDAPVISGTATGSVEEDGTLTVGGKLDVFDADTGDTATWSVVGGDAGSYGSLSIDESGRWSYALDNGKAQGLKAGETAQETFTVRVTDSEGASAEQTITVTVGGTNDVPLISGTSTGQVQEDVTLTASGTLTAADTDIGDTASWSVDGSAASDHGVFAVDPDSGQWTFTLDNDTAQGLKAGETIRETFTVRATDSAGASETHLVSLEIIGTNDGPQVGQALNAMGSMKEDTSVTFSADDLLRGAQVTDIDHDNLAITTVGLDGSSAPGTLVDNGNGTWTFTPNENVSNANAEIVFSVSDGHTSVTAQASVAIQPVADPADVSISSSALQEVIRTGAANDLGRIVAPQITTTKLPGFTLEFTVVGNSVPESTTRAGPVIVNIGSPPSDKNVLTLWDPANMKVGMSKPGGGDVNIATGVDLTDGESHRVTVTFDGKTNTIKVYDNGDLALTTQLPKPLPNTLYMAVAEKANTPPTTASPAGSGYRPNEHFEGTIFNVAMSNKAETAEQVRQAPLAEQMEDNLLIDLRAQNDRIVDTTGRNSIGTAGAIDTDALSVDTNLGSAPAGSVVRLDIDTKLEDPNDHISSLVISGFVAGTVVSDGVHNVTVTGPTQKIDITDWSRDNLTADLPDGVRTSMDLKVTATTTTPSYETGELDAQGNPVLATDSATSDEHHTLLVEGAGPPPPLPADEEVPTAIGPDDGQSGAGDTVVVPGGELPDTSGGTSEETPPGNQQETKPATPSEGSGETTPPPESGPSTADGSDTVPSTGADAGTGSNGSPGTGPTEGSSGGTTIGTPETEPPIPAGGGSSGETSTDTSEPPTTGAQPGGGDADGGTIPDIQPPLSAGGTDTTGDTSTDDTTEQPAAGSQPDESGTTTAPSTDGGTGSGNETMPGTEPPLPAGGGDTTGEASTGTGEQPITGTQPDDGGTTAGPSAGGGAGGGDVETAPAPGADGSTAIHPPESGSDGTGTITVPETEPPISAGDGGTSGAPPAGSLPGSGETGSETVVPGDGAGSEVAPPAVSAPVDANGQIDFVSVNDWYNPSWGGGYNATFQLTLTDDMLKGGSLEGWSLQIGVNHPNATVTTGWLDGFNGTVSFDPATGVFTNAGQDYQPELHAGDVIQFSIQVQNAGFDRNDFSFSFRDLDPGPEATADSGSAVDFTPTTHDVDAWSNTGDMQAASALAEFGTHDIAASAGGDHGANQGAPDTAPADHGANGDPAVHDQPLPSAASAYLEFVQPQADNDASVLQPADHQPSSADEYLQMAAAGDEQAGQEPPPPDHLFADTQIDHPAPGTDAPDTQPDVHHDDAAAAASSEPLPLEEDQNHHNH